MAGLVLDHAPELADRVLSGELALDAAQKEATERRDRAARLAALDEELAGLVEAGVISLDEAEARVERERRIADLPEDLAARVRDGKLALDEAELIVVEREERLDAWAAKVADAVAVLGRLAGHPVPGGVLNRLEPRKRRTLDLLLAGVPTEEDA